jgi:hypothetical protein
LQRKESQGINIYGVASLTNNDLENDEVYGVFSFIKDEQIGELAQMMKLHMMKATTWLKAIVTGYRLALTCFTKSFQAVK